MENTNITSLVQSSIAGNKEAFAKLYELSNKKAYFVALCVTKNEANAVNIIQSSYITAYQRLTKLKYPQMFVSWFNRIVAKNIFDELSDKNSPLFTLKESDNCKEFDDETNNIEEEMTDIVFSDKVNIKILETLDKLAFDEKLCFLMYYYFEMGIAEISKVLAIGEDIIIALLNRAKATVKAEAVTMLSSDEGAKDFPPMVFFCKALLKCSSHVPFRATDNILDSIFGAIPVSSKNKPEKKEQTKIIPPQNNDDATQMYTSEDMSKYMKSGGTDFTPYGAEYAKGSRDNESSSTDKVTQSAGKAAKIAIAVAVVLVFAIAVAALIKNVIVDKEKENDVSRTTVVTTAQDTTEEEYTTKERTTEETTTEETTTEEPTTEETTTEEITTEEPTTEEPSYEEPSTEEEPTVEEIPTDEIIYSIM